MKKGLFRKGCKYIFDRDYRFLFDVNRGKYNRMEDEEFLKKVFRASMGRELDLEHPQTFNEKLQWLKLYNRRQEYTVMVDKYRVREVVADRLGEAYLIPLLGVWDDPADIDFDALPEQFVLKCNHNSGLGMCICQNKSSLDLARVRAELKKGLEQDYYLTGREWPYKDVPRKIICEKYMVDEEQSGGLTDYKFFCFHGKADCVMVCLDRNTGFTKYYLFDRDWKLLRLNKRGKEAPEGFTIPMPDTMPEMFEIAEKLSSGLPYARIDLYSCSHRIYFGEITFFPDSGFDVNILPEADRYWGEKLELPPCVRG